jgi:hypothetical protein
MSSGNCQCAIPVGSSLAHCRSCCTSFRSVSDFDSHRINGRCHDLEGFYTNQGVYASQEGHDLMEALKVRLRLARDRRKGPSTA